MAYKIRSYMYIKSSVEIQKRETCVIETTSLVTFR